MMFHSLSLSVLGPVFLSGLAMVTVPGPEIELRNISGERARPKFPRYGHRNMMINTKMAPCFGCSLLCPSSWDVGR